MTTTTTTLPIEIIQRISMYMSSPTAKVIQESPYFQHGSPYTLLKQRSRALLFPFPDTITLDYCLIRRGSVLDSHSSEFDDIVETRLMGYIFRHRSLYERHKKAITKTLDDYTQNKKMYEMDLSLFKRRFRQYMNQGRVREASLCLSDS